MKDNADRILQDTPNTNFSKTLPPQFIWENISDRTFTESIRLPDIQMRCRKQKPSNAISEEQWLSHFQTLHSKHSLNESQHNVIKTSNIEELNKNQYANLDHPISDSEIRNAAKKLKKNKSAYSDRIKNEKIKCSTHVLLQALIKLFNLILEAGNFPSQWCEGLITPIFK
jgi:hypothetical protein